MEQNNIVYFPRNTPTGMRICFSRALAGDEAETGPGADPPSRILLPAHLLIGCGSSSCDLTIRWLMGGVCVIREQTRFLVVIPKR